VWFEPTAEELVEAMLEMAKVTKDDVVYDLGCGDGRIVITAAKKYGARGVGVDIDPVRIRESNENARKEGVTHLVRFFEKDLFETDIREATVVALYLFRELNVRLRPKLFRELRPGTRIVSNTYDMGEWRPDDVGRVHMKMYYYWVIPANVAGRWFWSMPSVMGRQHWSMRLEQQFQEIRGKVNIEGKRVSIGNAELKGDQLSFGVDYKSQGQKTAMRFSGQVTGDTIRGNIQAQGGPFEGVQNWIAKRVP
jgi:SAM-dependent methyltransferase